MTNADDRRRLIAQVAELPAALAARIAGLSDAQLDTLSPADPWTVRQITHHIADSHMNAFIRTRLALTEEHPTLRPYDQDAWALLADTRGAPVEATLALLRGLHARWVLLFESLDDAAWARGAYHPESGPLTVADLLASYAQHGADHLAQIDRIRAAQGW